MKTLIALVALTLSLPAQAANREDVRRAVNAIPEAKIQADVKAALSDNGLEGHATDMRFEYTICPVKLKTYCYRFVQLHTSKNGDGSGELVLEYAASLENNAVVIGDASSRHETSRNSATELNVGNINTFRLVLPLIENDYAGDMPVKYGSAIHPFNVSMMQIMAQGERSGMNEEEDHWDTSTNTLISFSEGVESRVVYFQTSLNYLVRTVDNGDKITKHDVRRLNFGSLLKR